MNELKNFQKSDSYKDGVFSVELIDENIFKWQVKIFEFDPEGRLNKTLQYLKNQGNEDHVKLRLSYRDDYPFKPPLVEIIYPVIGNVKALARSNSELQTLCLDLFKEHQWCSSCTIEALMVNLATHLSNAVAYPSWKSYYDDIYGYNGAEQVGKAVYYH